MSSLSRLRGNFSRAGIVLLLMLATVLGVLAWRYASHTATLLAYPYEWDEDEGYHVYFAKCLLNRQPIYGDINQVPMLPQTYPPVHAAVLSLFVRVLGPTLLAGRLVSLLAIAGLAVLVMAAVHQETNRWSLGLLAAVLVIGSPYIAVWGPLCRVDSLMLFLVFAGLLVVRQYPRSRAALIPGLLLLLLACYTKQQAVFLVPAAFVHIWQQNRRTALISLAGFAAAGLVVLVALQLGSGGNFWRNTVTSQATEFRFDLIITNARDFLTLHGLVLGGAIVWIVHQISRRQLTVWSVFALTTGALIILAGKNGAAFHYCVPAIVAVTVCAVLAIDLFWRSRPPDWPAAGAAQVLLLLLILQGVIFWLQPIREPTAADRQAGDRILSLVRGAKGDPLIERRAMFSVLSGRQPQADFCLLYYTYHQDQERAKTAAPPGSYRRRWEPQALVQAVRQKRYPLILMEPRFIPGEVVTEITANYQRLEERPISMGTWYGGNSYQLGVPK